MQVMCEAEATCWRTRNYSLVQTAGRIQTLFAQQYLSEINHTDPARPEKTTRTMGKAVCAQTPIQDRDPGGLHPLFCDDKIIQLSI